MSHLVLALIAGYKRLISPLLPASCRYQPTCSEYMADAVREYGALRGVWMGIRRLARCRPGGGSGYDPVPPRRSST